jgi:hypothetical protein
VKIKSMRLVTTVLAACAVAALAVPMPAAADEEAKKVCTIRDSRIDESSGLAASSKHPGIIYTFNDSGGRPQVFALDRKCRTRATLTFGGAENRDWEAMAIGPDGLYVGDIGDNLDGAWPYVTVYRIPEPRTLRSQTLHATAYRIKYADGPRNAETMMIDPRDGRLYIASKKFGGGAVYAGPKKLRTSGFNVMRRVGDAPVYATDGAFSPDGRTFVIRTYWDAEIFSAPDKKIADVSLPAQKQGEAITYTADGRSLLVGSEGTDQPLWQVPVPAAALPPTPSKHSKAAPGGGNSGDSGRNKVSWAAVLLVAGGLVLVGVLFARKRGS